MSASTRRGLSPEEHFTLNLITRVVDSDVEIRERALAEKPRQLRKATSGSTHSR